MEERIQKLLSAAGVCSRRTAETYITAGRVTVNGVPAELGTKADPERDLVCLDGAPVARPREPVYILLNKPRGCVTTLSDEKGRKTVAELVQDCGRRVYPIGRLDYDSEGLLLLTNDGDLTAKLTHPGGEIDKVYHVLVYGFESDTPEKLSALRELDGEPIRPASVELLSGQGRTAELSVTIHEGKNRQVRRMCAACGLTVKRLRRVREHTLELGDLPAGQWRYLTEAEAAALKE